MVATHLLTGHIPLGISDSDSGRDVDEVQRVCGGLRDSVVGYPPLERLLNLRVTNLSTPTPRLRCRDRVRADAAPRPDCLAWHSVLRQQVYQRACEYEVEKLVELWY